MIWTTSIADMPSHMQYVIINEPTLLKLISLRKDPDSPRLKKMISEHYDSFE